MTDAGLPGGPSSFGFIGVLPGPIVPGLLAALFRFENDGCAAANRAA